MSNLTSAKKLWIEAGWNGCFSATNYQVEIDTQNDPCQVCVTEFAGVGRTPSQRAVYRVPRETVDSFIGAVATILGKPEQVIGGRSTTVYHVKVNAADVPGFEPIDAKSSEMPKERLEEFINNERTRIEVRQKIQAAMVTYHNWAHEVFAATEAFIARCRREFEA